MSTTGYPARTPRSIRLGAELRKIREAAGLTMTVAATRVGRSQSWLSRVETGVTRPTAEQVVDLVMVAYEMTEKESAPLVALATNLDAPRWWEPLALQHRYLTYIGYEEEATSIRNWEQLLVPGLLQTEAYARAVLSVGWELRDGVTEERLEARMSRQAILTRKHNPVRLHAIMSEAVLKCKVGGPAGHRDQLRHLCKLADLPSLTMQIVPFSAGAHLAAHNAFTLLDFGRTEPKLGFADHLTGGWMIESELEIDRLEKVFHGSLVEYAMTPAESVDWIWEESWQS